MVGSNSHKPYHVIVIGAGSTGSATAHDLALRGLQVTVLERGSVAGGVTGNSFAWVGLSKSAAETYSDPFRHGAALELDRLERELVEPFGLRRRGAITWETTEAETRKFVDAHRALGHPVDLIGKEEILAREPGFPTPFGDNVDRIVRIHLETSTGLRSLWVSVDTIPIFYLPVFPVQ